MLIVRFSTSPSQCLPALSSAVLAMSSAEDEALDRLYAREFKRFISGKIVSSAYRLKLIIGGTS